MFPDCTERLNRVISRDEQHARLALLEIIFEYHKAERCPGYCSSTSV